MVTFYQVLIVYYLIFVLCISLAISYALIMLFEVMYILKIILIRYDPNHF